MHKRKAENQMHVAASDRSVNSGDNVSVCSHTSYISATSTLTQGTFAHNHNQNAGYVNSFLHSPAIKSPTVNDTSFEDDNGNNNGNNGNQYKKKNSVSELANFCSDVERYNTPADLLRDSIFWFERAMDMYVNMYICVMLDV